MSFWCISKNARINGDTRICNLLAELSLVQWDIVFFSEIRAPDNDIIVEGGHRLICFSDSSLYAGVAILVNAKWIILTYFAQAFYTLYRSKVFYAINPLILTNSRRLTLQHSGKKPTALWWMALMTPHYLRYWAG